MGLTGLLLRRWSKGIVCEHGPERSVYAVVVEYVVRKPPLDGCLSAERFEGWMRSGDGTGEATVSLVPGRTTILLANGGDAFEYFVGTKAAVFVIEAVTRTI